jgi:peptidoglycan/xylan/chitin deacetylase (PgdA/CDA1 family)
MYYGPFFFVQRLFGILNENVAPVLKNVRFVLICVFGCIISLTAVYVGVRWSGDEPASGQKIVALTFDDGPSALYTPQILDILKENGVHATFFVIGRNMNRCCGLVKREVDEGNAVGNHTWSHPLFAPLETTKQMHDEIFRTDSAIFCETGLHTSLFRPPHGWCSPWMKKSVEGMGFDVINWTVDPKDWKHPAVKIIVKRVDRSLGSSAIVLLHDGLESKTDPGLENTVLALRTIIGDFKAQGYRFVTVPHLIADPQFALKNRSLFKAICEPKKTPVNLAAGHLL